jgi:FeS assembly protein IscX
LRYPASSGAGQLREFSKQSCLHLEKRMPATFDWDDAEEIGIQLTEKYPDSDPLSVRYTDLHKYVTGLDGFTGDPKQSNEGKLEAIQMAWLEEHNERKS